MVISHLGMFMYTQKKTQNRIFFLVFGLKAVLILMPAPLNGLPSLCNLKESIICVVSA